jgi:hypothetical protein
MNRVLAALLALTALPAAADEVWTIPSGEVIYESGLEDGTAIFSAPAQVFMPDAAPDARAWIYIPELDYLLDARGVHRAFWVIEGQQSCPVGLAGPDGRTSTAWGEATIAFDQLTFPSAFTLIAGNCGFDPYIVMRAEPMLGD